MFFSYFIISVVSFTLRPGPAEEVQAQSSNESTTEPYLQSSIEPLEVTLSSLIVKNLADQLSSSLKISTDPTRDTLEKLTLRVANNVTSALKDIWQQQNVSLNETDFATLFSTTLESNFKELNSSDPLILNKDEELGDN